jgi:hypothetical protein
VITPDRARTCDLRIRSPSRAEPGRPVSVHTSERGPDSAMWDQGGSRGASLDRRGHSFGHTPFQPVRHRADRADLGLHHFARPAKIQHWSYERPSGRRSSSPANTSRAKVTRRGGVAFAACRVQASIEFPDEPPEPSLAVVRCRGHNQEIDSRGLIISSSSEGVRWQPPPRSRPRAGPAPSD